jgi:hypothetical protein
MVRGMGVLNEAAIERAVREQTGVLLKVLAELRALREAVGGEVPAEQSVVEPRRRFGR